MTLKYELHQDILKMYLRSKNELSRWRLSKLRAWTGQTDKCDQVHYCRCISGW